MNQTAQRAKEIFLALAGDVPAAEWDSRLDEMCAGNAALRQRVRALLQAHADPRSYLDQPAVDMTPDVEPATDVSERPGTQIGPYRLLQEIGQGGMGVVYMAEQHEPVGRTVALKIIRPGMDTHQVIARFEVEEQALAMMDHPYIARVFDAGVTDKGRPYFVMELVNGIPVTQFCDEQQLTARGRLELFISICQAVQHAHQKGIIHRDIKPSNILVALYDGRPVPKVIDFGVAKATGRQLTERTMSTGLGQIVGTVEYMSPEQAQRDQLNIDTRSDVYSLGVVLYELLTGDTPFDRQRLRSVALDELLRIIREEEPPKPSTKLSSSDALPSVAANRRTEPAKLRALVHGELDWIVMKALEKDRDRRYETANGLADDVRRYLNDEPVVACPPSAAYRFRKFARRNKVAVVTTGIVAAALVLGLLGTSWQAVRASIAERLARENERRAVENEQKAEASEKKAAEEAAVAKAVSEFLRQDLLGLAGAEAQLAAEMEPDPHLKLVTLLDRARTNVDERFADQPRVRAEVQDTLANAFVSIGRYAEASRLWEQVREYRERSLGPEHPDTLKSMTSLAIAYGNAGRFNEAIELVGQTLELQRRVLGPEHPDTLLSMHNLAGRYLTVGRHADALKLNEETLPLLKAILGPDDQVTLKCMGNLASSYGFLGRHADALKLQEETLAAQLAKLGPDHPDTLSSMHNLAARYSALGRRADALKLEEETLPRLRGKLGPDHPVTLKCMNNLAKTYDLLGRYADALDLHQETLVLREVKLGLDHPDTLRSMWSVAATLVHFDRSAEAVPIIDECLRRAAGKSVDPRLIPVVTQLRLRHFAKAKDAASCRATAEMWEKLKPADAASLYDAACMRAVTAAVIRANDTSETAAQAAAAEADRAMAWLAQAVAAGFQDIRQMKRDTDLDAIRDRQDFQKLLTDLEKTNEVDKQ